MKEEQIPGERLVMLGYLAGYTRMKAPKSRVGSVAAIKSWKIYREAWMIQLVKKVSRDINKARRMFAHERKHKGGK